MATTTRKLARQFLSENIGDFWSSTATTNGTTTTIVDTALINTVNGGDDDAFEGFYATITESGHSSLDETRRVKTYAKSNGTLTLESAFTAALQSGEAYELHRYHPDHKHVAIDRAVEEINTVLFLPLIDETLVINDILSNSDFEDGTFTSWAAVGSPTVTKDTSRVFHGAGSAKIVSGAGSAGQLTQSPTVNIAEFVEQSAEFWCFVFATEADVARIRLDWDGSDIDNSVFHSGADQWELLKLSAAVPDSATQVKAIVEVASGIKTAFFDSSRLSIGDIRKYTIPTAFEELRFVRQQAAELIEADNYRQIVVRPTNLRRLKLEGKGILTKMTSDTSTVEIGGVQIQLLIRYAQYQFWLIIASLAAIDDKKWYEDQAATAFSIYETQRDRLSGMSPMGAQERRGVYHTERDASGFYLVFDNVFGPTSKIRF